MSTIEDCADCSLFGRLLMLAERARDDAKEANIRIVVEGFLNSPKYADRVYVKRRTADPDEQLEALHEEGIFDRKKWQRIQERMKKDGGVNVGYVFGPSDEPVIVPMSNVQLTVVDDPCEVAAIDAMSLNTIARNAFERVGTDDADDADSGSDAESDAESDAS